MLRVEAFTMEIAGAAVGVNAMFPFTKEYCRAYLTEKEQELFVSLTPEDLDREQRLLEQEAIEEGLKIRKFPESFLERSALQRRVADFLAGRDILMLHGSTVAVEGRAYLFTAPCGTGKSTHTRLWRELLGDRAVMVNDDKPFLKITEEGALAYGSPWSGKHGLASNICVPLQGICLLHRGTENRICRGDKEQLREVLYRQVHMPEEASLARNIFPLMEALMEKVPLWEMDCNKELEAAKVAFGAMSGESTAG